MQGARLVQVQLTMLMIGEYREYVFLTDEPELQPQHRLVHKLATATTGAPDVCTGTAGSRVVKQVSDSYGRSVRATAGHSYFPHGVMR